MPRTLTRPQVGQVVWYFAASPPGTKPLAAMVVNTDSPTMFDLTVFAADGTTAPALNVPFHYGTRPTTGAWCTMRRVEENAAGKWPGSRDAAPPLGAGGVLT